MSIQPSRLFLIGAVAGMLCAPGFVMAQEAAKQPQCKDQAECDLYNAILKDANAKTRLDKLLQWEKQYPTSDFAKVRRTLLMTTHAGAGQPKEAMAVAKQILADDPKDFNALYYTMFLTQQVYRNVSAARGVGGRREGREGVAGGDRYAAARSDRGSVGQDPAGNRGAQPHDAGVHQQPEEELGRRRSGVEESAAGESEQRRRGLHAGLHAGEQEGQFERAVLLCPRGGLRRSRKPGRAAAPGSPRGRAEDVCASPWQARTDSPALLAAAKSQPQSAGRISHRQQGRTR